MGYTNTPYLPNPINASVAPGASAWRVLGINKSTRAVTAYSSVAALLAAGDRKFPGLDPGGKIGQCTIQALTSTGAVGSGVLYKLDPVGGTAPTTVADADNEVDGSGQQLNLPCPFRTIWIYCLASSDVVKIAGRH